MQAGCFALDAIMETCLKLGKSAYMHNVGQWLRDHRIAKKWTQCVLAERLGVATSTVSRWERNQGTPTLLEFRGCCLLFQASADEALGTGRWVITFAANGGRPPTDDEVTDGEQEERRGGKAEQHREGAQAVQRQAERGRASGARRRNGRLRGQDRGPQGRAVGAGAPSQDARKTA